MAEQKACNTFSARDVRYFHFFVCHSATKDLAAGQFVETIVTFVPGFKCTARCWPHCVLGIEPGWIKLSVVVTRTNHPLVRAPKVVVAHIELRTRIGLPVRTAMWEPELATGDCVGGVSVLARRDEVEKDCVVDDHLIALCTVAILDWPPQALPLPSGVGNDIFNMPDLMDVSFQVEGETFKAHRLVLAARSPVFKAELFGQMVESRASSITIDDMRAPTFKFMMDYMYYNVLPPLAPGDASGMLEFQHLFVAADRYALDKLKQACEEIMCTSISKNTVVSTLEFTEEHTCPKLKSKCLGFLDVAENFKEVGSTKEYLRLMNSYPSLQVEVGNWFKRRRIV